MQEVSEEIQAAWQMHHAALKSGDPSAYPEAFADIRKRLAGKTGQPILVAHQPAFRLGILRSDQPLFLGELELAFHTGPVGHAWNDTVTDKDGPLRLYQSETLLLISEVSGAAISTSKPPLILIGDAEIAPASKSITLVLFKKLMEAASLPDDDMYGRTRERERLAKMMENIHSSADFWMPPSLDKPADCQTVGEMWLALGRAKKLQLDHPLVETFERQMDGWRKSL